MHIRTLICSLALATIPAGLFAQEPVTVFKPSGKVYGYAFGDYYYKMHADSFPGMSTQYSGQSESTNMFDLRRVYLGYEYNISEKFSSDVLLSYEGNTLSDNATRTVFLKAANVRWKNCFKNTDVLFGLQSTPAFPMMAEKIWGYRAIEKTILDMRKGASSVDVGIGVQGKIGEKGNFGYNVLAGNGSGTKLETNIFKKFYGDFWAKFMDQKLTVDVYADFERTNMVPRYHKYLNTYKLGVFYTTDPITAGVEAYMTNQHNYVIWADTSAINPDTADSRVLGVSAFVRGTIIKDKLYFYARYDMFNPDMNFDTHKVYSAGSAPSTEMFITGGVDYTPHKNIHIMPNVWYNSHSSRVDGAKGAAKSDFDLVPRLTVWYVFK